MILSNLEVLSLSVHHKHRCPKNPKISHFASGGGKVGLMPLDMFKHADDLCTYIYLQSSPQSSGGIDFKQREL